MADRFYRSNNSDWNTDANWSTTSGGGADTTFPTATEDVIFDANSGNCTLDANAACLSLTLTNHTGTLSVGANNLSVNGDVVHGAANTLSAGSGTWTVAGSVNINPAGTFNEETAVLVMTGASKILASRFGRGWYSLTVSGSVTSNSSNGYLANGGTARIEGTFTLDNGTLGSPWATLAGSTLDVPTGGTLDGTGALDHLGDIDDLGGTLSVASLEFHGNTGTYTIASGTISSSVIRFDFSGTGSRTYRFGSSLVLTGDVTFVLGSGATSMTIDLGTNDTDLTLQGDLAFTTGGGAFTWTKGTGTITLSGANDQSIDFESLAVEDIVVNKTAGDVTMTGAVTTDSFTGTSTGTGDFDPGSQTITVVGNCSWAAAFTFEVGVATDVMDGSDWQISGNFTADGQTLPADSGWDLDVTGTAVASGAGDVSFSTAGGTEITATGWNDGGNNSGWNFAVTPFSPTLYGVTPNPRSGDTWQVSP